MSAFTCITCHVAFAASDIQREHYKSDWHRYNLKRKVAELPPVTAENFQERVKAHKAEAIAITEQSRTSLYCTICKKRFSTENAYNNHAQSRKHFELVEKSSPSTSGEIELKNENDPKTLMPEIAAGKSGKQTVIKQVTSTSEENGSEEEVGEWEDVEEEPLSTKQCLFCSAESETLEENVKHMTLVHSFFIPDIEFLTDMEGLITYLGEKVGVGNVCLWCNEKGKGFNSTRAVQNHMLDKGHCKLLHEGEVLAEYDEYYDYSSSYPEGETPAHQGDDDEVDERVLEGDDYQLVLPSGAVIGHRSLLKYYRQKLPPERQVARSKGAVNRVMSHYKALGWTGTTGEVAVRHARDVRYMRAYQMKHQLKLGVSHNKLQHHFRPQVNF